METNKKEKEDHKEYLPAAVEIEKDGSITRVFNTLTGKEIAGDLTVKMDMTSGKDCKAKITFEVPVTDVRVVKKQVEMFSDDDASETPEVVGKAKGKKKSSNKPKPPRPRLITAGEKRNGV